MLEKGLVVEKAPKLHPFLTESTFLTLKFKRALSDASRVWRGCPEEAVRSLGNIKGPVGPLSAVPPAPGTYLERRSVWAGSGSSMVSAAGIWSAPSTAGDTALGTSVVAGAGSAAPAERRLEYTIAATMIAT